MDRQQYCFSPKVNFLFIFLKFKTKLIYILKNSSQSQIKRAIPRPMDKKECLKTDFNVYLLNIAMKKRESLQIILVLAITAFKLYV